MVGLMVKKVALCLIHEELVRVYNDTYKIDLVLPDDATVVHVEPSPDSKIVGVYYTTGIPWSIKQQGESNE